jgi:putative transposase
MPRKGYPLEFRRRALDLIASGRKVVDVARDLGISDQTLYTWHRQERIDRGELPGMTSTEQCELAGARRRIKELEDEVAIHRRAAELLKERTDPKSVRGDQGDGRGRSPGASRPRILGVSESGYHDWRARAPSPRAIRHAWLSDVIAGVHRDSRQTYGARRVHAELTMGLGIAVGHCAVEMLMARAGIQGLSGRPQFRRIPHLATSTDLVGRQFHRDDPDRLWVTDITEHPTREGKVYGAAVLDVYSRRVVGGRLIRIRRPLSSPMLSAWPSRTAYAPTAQSCTATRARNTPLGPSHVGSSTRASCLRWVRSVIATTWRRFQGSSGRV